MEESKKRAETEQGGSPLTLGLILALVLILFGFGIVASIINEPEPKVMAPGPHYSYEEPLEQL